MIRIKQGARARDSYQMLRGKAHALLEKRFPNKHMRYAWLRRNAAGLHMSKLDKQELKHVISVLGEV